MQILIADDHQMIRSGIRDVLTDTFPEARFVEAENGEDALHKLGKASFQAMTLDLDMPGKGGLQVLKEVREFHPRLPVIIVSVHSDERISSRCLLLGASAFVNKSDVAEHLGGAVSRAISASSPS